MKTAVCTDVLPLQRSRLADYVELTKPRVAVLVLFTVGAGFWLGSHRTTELAPLLHTVCATALVAAGASALNQLLERHTDALMRRTEDRPLPAGRLAPLEVLAFGVALASGGLLYLAVAVRQPLAVLVAAVTFASYVGLYTPLKRKTTLNTLVGAVPGALPPIIGWSAAEGSLDPEALALFLILFVWQVPHFLAIAWIYRHDYRRAGLRMLPGEDPTGRRTGLHISLWCLTLVPVSLLPGLVGRTGPAYSAVAVVLGVGFFAAALGFVSGVSVCRARRVVRASLVYLPALLALLLLTAP